MKEKGRRWPVLSIVARGGPDGLEYLGHIRARRFPGGVRETGTLLRADLLDRLRESDREIGAVILDRRGRELRRHGFPSASRSFHERVDHDHPEHLSFRVDRDPTGVRQFDLRIPPRGRWVVFYVAQVRAGGIVTKPLLTFLLERRVSKARPQLPEVPGLSPLPEPRPLTFSRVFDEFWILADEDPTAGGFLAPEPETLHPKADPGSRFDVVFIGDGFTEAQMDEYNDLARMLQRGLRATQPFKRLDDLMNYHIVRAVSPQSGISGFNPDRTKQGMLPRKEDERRTYFGFSSDPGSYGEPGYFGVGSMERIRAATRVVTRAWSEVDLIIAIMRCPHAGGVGYLDNRLVAVSKHPDESPESFVSRVAHECGHAICGLAEEYITPDELEAGERYPNMATEFQRSSNQVWWWDLTLPEERGQLDGEFSVVHVYEDELKIQPIPGDERHGTIVPALPASDLKKLGLFWGAQCVEGELRYDPDEGFSYTSVEEIREAWRPARHYYRPMVKCRMRTPSEEYCRVCEQVIEDSVRAAASGQPRTSLHGVPKVSVPDVRARQQRRD